MLRTKMQSQRNMALLDKINRGLELTSHKRSPLRGRAQDRHCNQYLAAARRRGLLLPKDRMARELADW